MRLAVGRSRLRTRRELSTTPTFAHALMEIDYADQMLGASWGQSTREALEICITHGFRPRESVARALLRAMAFYAGRWGEAVEWFTSSRRVALEAGNDFGAAESNLGFADILIHQGRLDEAESVLRDAVRVLRASGIDFSVALGDMLQARLCLARGDVASADEQATEVVAQFLALGNPVSALEASLVRGEALVSAGSAERSLDILEMAELLAGDEATSLVPRLQLVRAAALLSLGRLDESAEAVATGLESARAQGLPFEQAQLLRVRSELRTRFGGADSAGMADADAAEATRILAGLGARV